MSTSLAEQLQRLAVPQTSLLKWDKKKPSLLFDPKEAANLKRSTVYEIGLEGLEELITKNEIFAPFRETLFHISSKNYDRSVQDRESNEKLNQTLRKFFLLLSPYFLLNASHKALEWLINRYMINEFNRDDLLMLILPYHETNIFVRVIQILQFKDRNDPFYFLKALQKPGLHLPKQNLLVHAASNVGFLKFVTGFILNLIKFHTRPNLLTVAFNFYCSIFCGVLEYAKEIKDTHVSEMLPLLIMGLKSNIPDFCAASYVITARLVTKTTLSNKLVEEFVNKISKVQIVSLRTEACLVLLVIYQSQKQYDGMVPTAVANLSEKEWLPEILQSLNNSGSCIYPFLAVLIRRSAEEGVNNDMQIPRDMVVSVLEVVTLDSETVQTVIHSILDVLEVKVNYSEEAKQWLSDVFQMIENQYPEDFDQSVYKILSAPKNEKTRCCLEKILKNTMKYKGKFELVNKLYHPRAELRGEAIKYLTTNYVSLKETDQEIIKNALIYRLNDDKPNVVQETLKLIKTVSVFDTLKVKDILIDLINKLKGNNEPGWTNVRNLVLNMLCAETKHDWNVFLAVFPYLQPDSEKNLKTAQQVLQLPFFLNSPLLKPTLNKLQVVGNSKEFRDLVLTSLQKNCDVTEHSNFLEILNSSSVRRCWQMSAVAVILANTFPQNSSLEASTAVLEILLSFFRHNENKLEDAETFLQCLNVTINKTETNSVNLGLANFSDGGGEKFKFFVLVASILLYESTAIYKKYLNLFLDHFCKDIESKINLLLNICISENKLFSTECKTNALKYITKEIKDVDDSVLKPMILLGHSPSIYLAILLNDPDERIRKMCLNILVALVKSATRKTNSYFHFIDGLLKQKEEIQMDNEQMAIVVSNVLHPTSTKRKNSEKELNHIRKSLLASACNYANPIYVKSGLLKLLSQINSLDIFEETSKLVLDMIEQNPNNTNIHNRFEAIIILSNINRIEASILGNLTFGSNVWNFLEKSLKCDNMFIETEEKSKTSLSGLVLSQLNRDVIDVLSADISKRILDIICEVATKTQNPEILPSANRIFKHIDLDANDIIDQLVAMRDIRSAKQEMTKKRRSIIPTFDILDMIEWKKGVTMLEFIQDKKKIRNTNSLLPVLFEILKKCLDFDEQSAIEYPKQLALSLILLCCNKMEEESLPSNVFNMELVVQCIRASQNPQTHHHALLVLARTAEIVPTQVLHHIMAIFTFMGSSLLRHDDAYSFQIIEKIIDTVIPILVQDNNVGNIAKVLRVFVDALLDIPEHRRVPLYKQLLRRLNEKENLFVFLLLVLETQVLHNNESRQKKESRDSWAQGRLNITTKLCYEFSPDTVILGCISLLKFLKQLPVEKEDVRELHDGGVLNLETYTPKQYRHFKYALLTFTSSLLASKEFIDRVATLPQDKMAELESLYKEVIIKILLFIQDTSVVAEKAVNTPHALYWKRILHYSYEVLDSVNALVTPQMFLLITKGLVVHSLNTVNRKILELLNLKLENNVEFFADCNTKEVYSLIASLIDIIEKSQLAADQEKIVQTALVSLKLLIKSQAPKDPQEFIQILEYISSLLNSGKAQGDVLGSLILCLAELCVNLKAYAIPCLADFMPAFIKTLKKQKHQETTNWLLFSVLTAVQKLFDSLPMFLSPYLDQILTEISILMSKWTSSTADIKQFLQKLTSIKQKIGSVLPARILIPAVERSYAYLINKRYFNAVKALMDIFSENLSNLKGADITANLSELTNFFIKAMQFRSDGLATLEQANVVEEHIVSAFTVLILKLSESSFRPLYYKLFDWAVRTEDKSEKLITFYSLSSGIAHSLKGLFVLFAGHFISNAAQTLDALNTVKTNEVFFKEKDKNTLLLDYILKTLYAVFLYDTQQFINKERFAVLMQPLVDQLENTMDDTEALQDRNVKFLTPCIVQLMLSVSNDVLWKQMNYQILLKLRSPSPEIRLVALHCLTEIVFKLGEEFLPMLPETIPFLSELLEDEDEKVEKACQKSVQEMEKVLGEPLQKYF